MRRGESTMGRFACMWRLTSVMSSWDDNADMKEFDESDCDSDESGLTCELREKLIRKFYG